MAMTAVLRRRDELHPRLALAALLLPIVLIEAVLAAADHGLWGDADWRRLAYFDGAFWPSLLTGGQSPFHDAQPTMMFVTYGFLHTDTVHAAVNTITLLSLGSATVRSFGPHGFTLIYMTSLVGGAFGYALLGPAEQPMVGASGALFGLLAAVLLGQSTEDGPAWQGGTPLRLPCILILALIAPNLLMVLAMNGAVAWQTHVGGYIAGGLMAGVLMRRQHLETFS